MATVIDQSVLEGIFAAHQQELLTTQATFWNINDGGAVPTYPTVYVPGNTSISNLLCTPPCKNQFVSRLVAKLCQRQGNSQ